MTESASQLSYLQDPRLAAHAIGAAPAWLWAPDGSRILWSNAVGAAIFNARAPAELASRRFDAKDRAASQIARMAPTLPSNGAPRLERLRGFGAGLGRALTCACAHITLPDNTVGILVLAAEAAGPSLPLEERVRRLVAEVDAPIAVFSAEGDLLHAAQTVRDRLAAAASLSVVGADQVAAEALRGGHASGHSKVGDLSIARVGQYPATVLVATLAPQPIAAETERETPPEESASAVTDAQEAAAPEIPSQPASAPAETKPAAPPAAAEATPAMASAPASPLPERRYPLRFVWQMDANGRFTIDSGDFIRLTGRRTAEALGRPWIEIAAILGVDPKDEIARAVASRDTWSGITIDWPVQGTDERLAVELSGLPVFDRERAFGGYRGFGVCRDARRISRAASLRHTPDNVETGKVELDDIFELPTDAIVAEKPADKPPPAPALTEERPVLTVVPPSINVVPFRAAQPPEKTPSLDPMERSAFRELAKQLTSRLQGDAVEAPTPPVKDDFEEPAADAPAANDTAYGRITREVHAMGFVPAQSAPPAANGQAAKDIAPAPVATAAKAAPPRSDHPILDRLPVGVLVYRLDTLLYGNRAFLDWAGYDSVMALATDGGLDTLFIEPGTDTSSDTDSEGRSLTISTNRGDPRAAHGRMFMVPWDGENAHVLILAPAAGASPRKAPAVANAPRQNAAAELDELKAILETASDGVLLLDREGRIVQSNGGAQGLFGYDGRELAGLLLADLLVPESQRTALDYLDRLIRNGANERNHGCEVIGRARTGGLMPLFMTVGHIGGEQPKLCAVFRDLTPWKRTEEELINAKRQAEKASSAKSDFLAKISHEIRTPLNAIIGFSEVMMGERFGPIANERYREYLKDIHASGGHLVSLLNDLLDLSKIEAGKLDLTFAGLNLNELTQQCVALMQPQANQERVIIRSSLPPVLPPVVADARSVRQIVLNLLSNSIKFTGAGGQVIVSTALADNGDVALRVRDSGAGMNEREIEMALEPFRQLATSGRAGSGGTGLGLPLTKALAEANHARFSIKSAVNAGTLVEISFPRSRVLAQ